MFRSIFIFHSMLSFTAIHGVTNMINARNFVRFYDWQHLDINWATGTNDVSLWCLLLPISLPELFLLNIFCSHIYDWYSLHRLVFLDALCYLLWLLCGSPQHAPSATITLIAFWPHTTYLCWSYSFYFTFIRWGE